MVSLQKKTDVVDYTVEVYRDSERIYITVELQNISDEDLVFHQSNPEWCTIHLYDSNNENRLERMMTTASYVSRTIEPEESLEYTRETDTKEDWIELCEELATDLDDCTYVTLDSETCSEQFTVLVRITLDISVPKMHLKFTPDELEYK